LTPVIFREDYSSKRLSFYAVKDEILEQDFSVQVRIFDGTDGTNGTSVQNQTVIESRVSRKLINLHAELTNI